MGRGGGAKSALSEKQRAALERLHGRCGKREHAVGAAGVGLGPSMGAGASMGPVQEEDLPAAQVTDDADQGTIACYDQVTGAIQSGQAVIAASLGWGPADWSRPTNGFSQPAMSAAPAPRTQLVTTTGWTAA